MDLLELQLPAPEHKAAANDFKDEFFKNGETIINGSALLITDGYGNGWRLTQKTAIKYC
jgi:hypothetical protein